MTGVALKWFIKCNTYKVLYNYCTKPMRNFHSMVVLRTAIQLQYNYNIPAAPCQWGSSGHIIMSLLRFLCQLARQNLKEWIQREIHWLAL